MRRSQNCSNKTFQVVNTNAQADVVQHVWALVALLKNLSDNTRTGTKSDSLSSDTKNIEESMSFTEYNDIVRLLKSQLNRGGQVLFDAALEFLLASDPSTPEDTQRYYKVLHSFETIHSIVLGATTLDPLVLQNTFVSLVNYHGLETYFTRGAFIDVVVNQQMCRKMAVLLGRGEYIDSFVENLSELITHPHKEKYLERALHAGMMLGLDESVYSGIALISASSKHSDYLQLCENIVNAVSAVFNTNVQRHLNRSDIEIMYTLAESLNIIYSEETNPIASCALLKRQKAAQHLL